MGQASAPHVLSVSPSAGAAKTKGRHQKNAQSADGRGSAGSSSTEVKKLAICVLGIYACYLSAGMLQEGIISYRTVDGERFSATMFLLWVPCVVNVVCAFLGMQCVGTSGEKMPQHLFGVTGSAYIGAMILSIEALQYVNFPTKELGKSCKMIPVMLFGVLFAKKQYSVQEYLCVALITMGIVIFNLAMGSKTEEDKQNSTYGLCLLVTSLVFDGVMTSSQERLKAICKPTVYEMMFYTNAWALGFLSAAAFASGQFVKGSLFCADNPLVIGYVVAFSLAAACGQFFIYYTITTFNPLACATITTTRKFFTIVFSVITFGHTISLTQWGGVVMVFVSIGFYMHGKHKRPRGEEEHDWRHEESEASMRLLEEGDRDASCVGRSIVRPGVNEG